MQSNIASDYANIGENMLQFLCPHGDEDNMPHVYAMQDEVITVLNDLFLWGGHGNIEKSNLKVLPLPTLFSQLEKQLVESDENQKWSSAFDRLNMELYSHCTGVCRLQFTMLVLLSKTLDFLFRYGMQLSCNCRQISILFLFYGPEVGFCHFKSPVSTRQCRIDSWKTQTAGEVQQIGGKLSN